jgi:uncharacterized protein YndB with AHSA1/START domain
MTEHIAKAEVEIAASPEDVWSALTDPAAVKKYMFGADVDTTWEVGAPITWSGEYDGRAYQDKGEVVRFDAPERLTLTHYSPMGGLPDEPENYHHLDYRIEPVGDGSRVLLEQDGNESPEQAEQFSQNWQMSLNQLKEHVES